MPEKQFESWGWRVPFLLGAVCVVVGYIIRRRVEEPPAFEKMQSHRTAPPKPSLFAALREHPRSFLIVVGTRMGENGFAYLLPVFGVAYVSKTLELGDSVALWAVMIASAIQLITVPFYGALSDRVGRKPVYIAGAVGSILWLAPFFMLTGTGSTGAVILAFAIGLGFAYPAMLAPPSRLVRRTVRYRIPVVRLCVLAGSRLRSGRRVGSVRCYRPVRMDRIMVGDRGIHDSSGGDCIGGIVDGAGDVAPGDGRD